MPYRILAVDCTFGTSLSTCGPGLSAFIRLTWEPPVRGSRESRNTRTPMPPIQWVKLRQNRMPLGRPSTPGRMLAPVVVKPETVSNIASTGFGMQPVRTNGTAPMILMVIQLRAVAAKPSRI